jgi:hypothetical protein
VPDPHAEHVDDTLAPVAAEYRPATQFVQPLAPVAAWYVPVPQFVQPLAPDAEYVPIAQLKQFAWPVFAS